MAGYGYLRHSNRGVYNPPPDAGPIGSTVWQLTLPGGAAINTGIVCQPADEDQNWDPSVGPVSPVETIYFGSDDGYLNAVSISGRLPTLKWRFPVVENGVYYPVCSSPTLVKFTTGDPNWGICFGADNGRVYCLRDAGPDPPTVVWRSARLGDPGTIVRGSPLYRPGRGMQQGAVEQYPSLVFVGAVTPDGGRLVGLPVNAAGNEVAPAAGYSTSPPYGIIGSVSYLAEWVQFGSDWHINGGFLFVTDLEGNLRCWHDNLGGMTSQPHISPRDDNLLPIAPSMVWPCIVSRGDLSNVALYYCTAAHADPNYGGFIYGVKADLDWMLKTASLSWLWPNLTNRRLETVPYPSFPMQHLNMGFMYADGCVGTSGMPFFSSWRAGAGDPTGPQTPAGTLQRVDASPVGAVATPIFRNTTHPTDRDLRATPCIAQGPGTGELLYFVTSTGWLYAVTSSGAMPLEFPVYLGGTVGSTDPYGARPHVVIDGEGIIYIGNNNGVMRAIWAKRS